MPGTGESAKTTANMVRKRELACGDEAWLAQGPLGKARLDQGTGEDEFSCWGSVLVSNK